jgi:hypothetical protein
MPPRRQTQQPDLSGPLADDLPLPRSRSISGRQVDLVFIVDCTGSMQPCIDALKANIAAFVDYLQNGADGVAPPVGNWRARIVGYRDFEFDPVPLEPYPFVSSVAELESQLQTLVAEGGVDEPECLLDALYYVACVGQSELGQSPDPALWRHRSQTTRVAIVFTDATFKNMIFLEEARGGSVEDVMNALVTHRVLLSIFAPSMACYDEFSSNLQYSEYEAIPVAEDQTPQKALADYTQDRSNFDRALKQLAVSISRSVATDIF